MVVCPSCDPEGLSSFFAVFDGTCGDHASEFAQKNFMRFLFQEEVRDYYLSLYCIYEL